MSRFLEVVGAVSLVLVFGAFETSYGDVSSIDPLAAQFEAIEGEDDLPDGFLDASVRPVPIRLVGEGDFHQQMTVREYTRRAGTGDTRKCGEWREPEEDIFTLLCDYAHVGGSSVGYYFTYFPDAGVARVEVYRIFRDDTASPVHADIAVNTYLGMSQAEIERAKVRAREREEENARLMEEHEKVWGAKSEIALTRNEEYQALANCVGDGLWQYVEGSPDEYRPLMEVYGELEGPLYSAVHSSKSWEELKAAYAPLSQLRTEYAEVADACNADLSKWREEQKLVQEIKVEESGKRGKAYQALNRCWGDPLWSDPRSSREVRSQYWHMLREARTAEGALRIEMKESGTLAEIEAVMAELETFDAKYFKAAETCQSELLNLRDDDPFGRE